MFHNSSSTACQLSMGVIGATGSRFTGGRRSRPSEYAGFAALTVGTFLLIYTYALPSSSVQPSSDPTESRPLERTFLGKDYPGSPSKIVVLDDGDPRRNQVAEACHIVIS